MGYSYSNISRTEVHKEIGQVSVVRNNKNSKYLIDDLSDGKYFSLFTFSF
jgi:hypothetical protein